VVPDAAHHRHRRRLTRRAGWRDAGQVVGNASPRRHRGLPHRCRAPRLWLAPLAGALSLTAARFTTGGFIPQTVTALRAGSAEGLAWGYLVLLGIGIGLWLIHGLRIGDGRWCSPTDARW